MRSAVIVLVASVALAVLVVAAHLALIEVGREVVTLRTRDADGRMRETRLWIVDDGTASWLHSGGARWRERFAGDPIVEVERGGVTRRYQSYPTPGPHPRVDELLREKYGFADRWVRLIAPCGEDTLPVRLEPLG